MQVVLDTNILLSGLMLPESIPGKIVGAWRAAQFNLILSEPLLNELGRVLAYPKINARLKWDEQRIRNFLLLLRFKGRIVDVSLSSSRVPADPEDTPVLATLIAGNADYLVTGDSDLLALRKEHPIITAAEFVRKL